MTINELKPSEIILLITALILFLHLIAFVSQIVAQKKEGRYNRTFSQIERLENMEFHKIRNFVFNVWDGQYPVEKTIFYTEDGKTKRYTSKECNAQIKIFSNTMDVMGKLYLEKYIDQNIIIDLYGHFIQIAWKKCKNFINHEQQKRNKYAEEEYKKTKAMWVPSYPYQYYFRKMVEDIKKRYPTDPSLKKEVKQINKEILRKVEKKK